VVYRLGCLIALALFGAASALAEPDIFSGTFGQDDQVLQLSLISDGTSTTVIDSYGYAGGSVGSDTFAPGGFAPEITLYDSTGAQFLDSNAGFTGNCAKVAVDPVSGNCDDPYINQIIPVGAYTLALTVFDNFSFDGTLADGFKQDGNPGFTCNETGTTGQFCDVTDALGRSRTGDYAFSIATIPAVTATPEPSALALTFCGLLLAGVSRARHAAGKHNSNCERV
jgi:hypothetical protein